MFSKELFGLRLREARKKSGEPQNVIAGILGVTVTQISEMENGKKTTTEEKIALICAHYKISADYLLGLEDEEPPL